jgi:hypothetical protein
MLAGSTTTSEGDGGSTSGGSDPATSNPGTSTGTDGTTVAKYGQCGGQSVRDT